MRHPRYRITPTTADIGIEVWGGELAQLFTNAAGAILELITDTSQVRKDIAIEFEVEGRDTAGLLVNWLNEIIFLHEAKEMVFAEVQLLELTDFYIKGRLQGEAVDLNRHQLKNSIKGVTYHRLDISRSGEH